MANYNEIIKEVATKAEVSQKDTKMIVDNLMNVITETLSKGEDVKLTGIGTFKVVEKAGRTGIIQMGARKGETYSTEPSKGVKFAVAKALKEIVKEA